MENIDKKEILTAISELDKKFDRRFGSFAEQVDGKLESFAEQVDGKLESFAEQVDGKLESFAEQVDGKLESFAEQVDGKLESFAEQVDGRLNSFTERFERRLKESEEEILEAVGIFSEQVDQRFEGIESRLTRVETTMVTKSYLDDKLGDLKGDLVSLLRKEDQKVNRFISVLSEKRILAPAESKDILSFKIFP